MKMLLDVDDELPVLGRNKMESTRANELVLSAYLHPCLSTAIDHAYKYSERSIRTALSSLYNEPFSTSDETYERNKMNMSVRFRKRKLCKPTHGWSASFRVRATDLFNVLQYGTQYVMGLFASVRKLSGKNLVLLRHASIGLNAKKAKRLPKLGQIARLFLTVPASTITRERMFSELKCRSATLRNRKESDILGRDAVIYAWYDSEI